MVKRTVVEIDEAKCNGCGECVPKCTEGALKIVAGKARVSPNKLHTTLLDFEKNLNIISNGNPLCTA